jgi:CRISPR-associated endoribonuclease Cas6
MGMLASFIVSLQPLGSPVLKRDMGRSLHRLLFALMKQVDPELADRLHSGQGLRPFTVSPLLGRLEHAGPDRVALTDDIYHVRYTCLTEEVTGALSRILLGKLAYEDEVKIDWQPFRVAHVEVDPQLSEGWADLATYAQLCEQAAADRRIRLEFGSPTTFRTSDVNLLFPLPESVFGSYLCKWEEFSPTPLSDGLAAFLDGKAGNVVAERYELATEIVPYGARGQVNGFVGHCQYRVLGGDEAIVRELNALADFALFAGTGQKTTHGLGQTRRLPPL